MIMCERTIREIEPKQTPKDPLTSPEDYFEDMEEQVTHDLYDMSLKVDKLAKFIDHYGTETDFPNRDQYARIAEAINIIRSSVDWLDRAINDWEIR